MTLDYLYETSVITRVLIRGRQEGQRRRCNSTISSDAIDIFEDGGSGHEPRNADSL